MRKDYSDSTMFANASCLSRMNTFYKLARFDRTANSLSFERETRESKGIDRKLRAVEETCQPAVAELFSSKI